MWEVLNQIPYGVFLILYLGCFSVVVAAAAVSRCILHLRALSIFILWGGIGSFLGFVVMTLPWIILEFQAPKHWPIIRVWPYVGPGSGHLTAALIGICVGSGSGLALVFYRKKPQERE